MPAVLPLRAAVGLIGLAGALGACTPPLVPAPTSFRFPGDANFSAASPPRPHVAQPRTSQPACERADKTGLSDMQKEALFRQFDDWQARSGDAQTGSSAPPPAARLAASKLPCRTPAS